MASSTAPVILVITVLETDWFDLIFLSLSIVSCTLFPVCLCKPSRKAEGKWKSQGERQGGQWQESCPQNFLWHAHTQTDHPDCTRAEADTVLFCAHDHPIQPRTYVCPPWSGTPRQPQWTLQGAARGQECESPKAQVIASDIASAFNTGSLFMCHRMSLQRDESLHW